MFAKVALILSLLPGLLGQAHLPAHGGTQQLSRAVVGGRQAAARMAQRRAATARATERKLLVIAPREKFLHRFVDPATGLVKRNVAAHCTRSRVLPTYHRLRRFICRVWLQPQRSVSGVAVLVQTRAHVFRVTAYHRRHRHHRSRN